MVANKAKGKHNDRPAAINVVMLRNFTTQVPKGTKRRQLLREDRIKIVFIPKSADHEHVHNKIKSAFNVNNFVVLVCFNGHRLTISAKKFVDGKLALQRRGCLYLCEVSSYMVVHACSHMYKHCNKGILHAVDKTPVSFILVCTYVLNTCFDYYVAKVKFKAQVRI